MPVGSQRAAQRRQRTRPTLLQQNTFQQRVLVPQHEALVGRGPVALLQARQGVFVLLDSGFKLLDILSATLAKGSLRLPVALLALFGSRIDLEQISAHQTYQIV